MTKYYVDTCIWLNLFNKEQRKIQNLPVWKIAELFLEQYQGNLIVSNKVIKEIISKISSEQLQRIAESAYLVEATQEEFSFAQEIESKERYQISFFDCIHIAICTKRNYILITRDKELLERAKAYVTAGTPEQFLY